MAAAFAFAGVTAPGASALNYCVQFVDPAVCEESPATLQEALDAAADTLGVADVIHIGPGTITENGTDGNGLVYKDTAGLNNDVTLIGRGKDLTRIQRADAAERDTFFIRNSGSHVTVQDLELFIVDINPGDAANVNPVRADTSGGTTLTRVRVRAEQFVLPGVKVVFASAPLTISDSTIDGGDNHTSSECLRVAGGSAPVVTGTEFKGCEFGVFANASGNPSIDRSTFSEVTTGAQIEGSSSISINRSMFIGIPNQALNFTANGQFRFDNSLVTRTNQVAAIRVAPTAGNSAQGTVNQSTIVGTDPSAKSAIDVQKGDGAAAGVEVYDTVMAGLSTPTVNIGAVLTTDYSFYRFDNAQHGAPGPNDIDSLSDTVVPGFVNPPNDFSLASGSLLRDRDPNTGARPGEVITTDLAGGARISNGARDIGAYEFQFVPPVNNPPTNPPTTLPSTIPTTPAAGSTATGRRAAALKKCKKKKKGRARANCQKKARKLPL